ncbi:MAG: type II toxin-antitoxin system HicB family antitoxin [Chlamydiia bacterium]|nr:type II toxin-antitoxin system HicB family antitoxin [Chlamydiia bacterium]
MEFEGKVWKSTTFWVVEVTSLDLMTQGETKEEALKMLEELIIELADYYFTKKESKDFDVCVNLYKKGVIGVSSSKRRLLLALSLKRQREKSQSTVRETAKRLGSKFPNSYAQYEKGKIRISLEQYEKLLTAANPNYKCLLRVI